MVSHNPGNIRVKTKKLPVWLCPCLSFLILLPADWTLNGFLYCILIRACTEKISAASFLSSFVIFFLPPVHGFLSWRLWYLVNNLSLLLTDRSDRLQSFQKHCLFVYMHHSHPFLSRLDQSQCYGDYIAVSKPSAFSSLCCSTRLHIED